MKRIFLALLLLVPGVALAGEDSGDRYWAQPLGPAWYDVPCGLPCFAVWQQSGLGWGDVQAAELRAVRTLDDMKALIARRR